MIERGGQALAKGKDPYHEVTNRKQKVVYHDPGQSDGQQRSSPTCPSWTLSASRVSESTTSRSPTPASSSAWPRWWWPALALWLCPADGRRKMRAMQVIAILPTAALPLATGGDDMPVVAFLLLAMVLAQRRQPFAVGRRALGIVSAMKFTAWPLAALALFAARNRRGQPAPLT